MKFNFFKPGIFLIVCFLILSASSSAQTDVTNLRNSQLAFTRVAQAYSKYNDTIRKLFTSKALSYPPKDIYIREFKSQNEMELWARENPADQYKLIKIYRVCALSGILGPKRFEGDRQVPEGSYFIEDFNPQSDFFLSMLINYPNYSDVILGDKKKPGGDIYIHGGCVTVGCVPMTDEQIQELYVVCLNSKLNGQNYIPINIYPTRFNKKGLDYLGKAYQTEQEKQKFWVNLKAGYDYFETYKKLMPVMYTPEGKYVF
ncbi:MAG: L,D-transpeptidase family protein [Chitinophagaceae bacterium]|jgi:murein L,D-transpeptidase YafK